MTQNTLTKDNSLQSGKYKIERVLGQGAFGITYQAKHTMLNMPVAIKELFLSDPQKYCTRDASDKTVNPNFDIDEFEKFKERFLDEATTLARFKDCHNIVNVSDIFSENATVYFVMDYIEGQSLTQSVKAQNGQLSLETATNYIKQIASALDFIHNKNILHRDIKPDNILIKPDGTAVLIDFGIARSYTDGKTSLQTTFHTPGYSPPEQKVANAKRGAYTDIFALGGTFYFCLTGNPPQTMDDININGFISVKDINPQIPENINTLITKSIQQRRESRQQNIAEFINDLGIIKNKNNKESVISDVKTRIIEKENINLENKGANTETLGNYTDYINEVPIELIFVEGSSFSMGSNHEMSEQPIHKVTLDNFHIGKYTVTQNLWETIMGNNPSNFKKGKVIYGGSIFKPDLIIREDTSNYPVESITWDDVQEFLKKLNTKSKYNYRLPTEAELEYSAHGGEKSEGYMYAGSNDINEVAWYAGNSNKRTHTVGEKRPNELGIYDMSGNIYEWCNDKHAAYYYQDSPEINPIGPLHGLSHSIRGGSWHGTAKDCRITNRHSFLSEKKGVNLGLRLAIDSKP